MLQQKAVQQRGIESWENVQALVGNLMAAEDLNILFDANISAPANIDVKRRIIRVARLMEHQQHLLPGLIAHEISHAIWTRGNEPVDPILNMIEDGYIERMCVKKYPGAKKHLRTVFNEFFGDEKENPQQSLVVRILNTLNYNCKGLKFGKTQAYPKEMEKADVRFLKEVVELTTLPTLSERYKLAKQVKKMLKKYNLTEDDLNQMQNDMAQSAPQTGDDQEPQEPQEGGGSSIDWDDDEDEKEDKDEKENKGKGKKGKEDKDGDDESSEKGGDDKDGDEDGSTSGAGDDKDGDEDSDGDDADGSGKGGDEESDDDADGSGKGGDEDSDDDSDGAGDSGGADSDDDSDGAGKDSDDDSDEKGGGAGSGGDDDDDEAEGDDGDKTDSNRYGDNMATGELDDVDDEDTSWLDDHLADKENGELNDHHDKFDTVGSHTTEAFMEIASPEAVYEAAKIADVNDIEEPKFAPAEKNKVKKKYTKELAEARKVASVMYQRFAILKNASEMANTQYEKTGALDITRLVNYKTDDDIFVTKRIQPDGKNHAISLILDWSGSMRSDAMDLWRRTAEFVEFARLSETRVAVYTFTTTDSAKSGAKLTQFDGMAINHGQFIKLVDTGACSLMEIQKRLYKFWLLAASTGYEDSTLAQIIRRKTTIPRKFGMGGTNIVEGHAFATYVAQRLNAEKTSIIVVCDGDDYHTWDSSVAHSRAFGSTNGNDIVDGVELQPVDNASHVDSRSSEKTYLGRTLPDVPAKYGRNSGRSSYYGGGHTGDRARALYAQVIEMKKQRIPTVGIYLGSLGSNKLAHSFPYDGNLVEWNNLAKGNAFIGQLISQIA